MRLIELVRPRLNHHARRGMLGERQPAASISKVIYQTYPTRDVPASIQANIDHIQALNPGWRYQLFTDEEVLGFITSEFGPDMRDYYLRIDPAYGAARMDLFRYLLIYARGGVYLDVKSTLTRPLDEVLLSGDRYLLSRWQGCGEDRHESWGMHDELASIGKAEFQQWQVIAAAGHPFLRAVIENMLYNIDHYVPSVHGVGKDGVLRLTGPIAYTQAITPLIRSQPHRLVRSFTDLGLRYSIYDREDRHVRLFKTHYSQLRTPVVALGARQGAQHALWWLLRGLKQLGKPRSGQPSIPQTPTWLEADSELESLNKAAR